MRGQFLRTHLNGGHSLLHAIPQVLSGVETGIAGAYLSPGPSQLASSLVRGVFVFSKGIRERVIEKDTWHHL